MYSTATTPALPIPIPRDAGHSGYGFPSGNFLNPNVSALYDNVYTLRAPDSSALGADYLAHAQAHAPAYMHMHKHKHMHMHMMHMHIYAHTRRLRMHICTCTRAQAHMHTHTTFPSTLM